MPSSVFRSLFTSLFIFAGKPYILFFRNFEPLRLLRRFILSAVLVFLRLLTSIFAVKGYNEFPIRSIKSESSRAAAVDGRGREPAIARALAQILSIVTDIPVSSRKYEGARSLAEKFIDENVSYESNLLTEVNCDVLSAAFCLTLKQLESALIVRNRQVDPAIGIPGGGSSTTDHYQRFRRVIGAAGFYWDLMLRGRRSGDALRRLELSAEKLAAELLWLAHKMTACGCAQEALCKWASAQHLARVSLSAEPRLQDALVKVSAFLLDQAMKMWEEADEESMKCELRETNMNVMVSWLPLLCRASNGTDTPVLSVSRRAEVERTLEQMINTLEEEEQERVLSLWLHHFTYCSSSDWPNLHSSYSRWFSASRASFLCSLN
ncbi:unnamed protein product [Cuscuta campestris]|uniref:Uncharacterized protein n=2 Tax=Cuscuta sect. Cleistogrammica TaxID=1824901 RepID=A0A484LP83_9ASTE|nr:hypothetical protein DM860_003129 [Cuscuta australis]VFQ78225.1 unnamed protein product [Cuscuta campestris]